MTTTIFAKDVHEPEGPVWAGDGTLYLVEMGAERRCLSRIDPASGVRRTLARTRHRPNGLAIDGNGRLWLAEAYERAVLCFDRDGRLLKRMEGPADHPFRWPNDLVFAADGSLYLTDSGITEEEFLPGGQFRDDYRELPYDGRVFQIDPARGTVVRQLDAGLRFANGIAIGPDGLLYVNETITGDIFRYDLTGAADRKSFGNVIRQELPPSFRGPDGMKFGADGRLYCTVFGQGDVTVLAPDGSVHDRLATLGDKPTNIAFRPGATWAAVTEVAGNAVERLDLRCAGAPLNYPVFDI